MGPTIGVDLGGTKLLAGVVGPEGQVLARERRAVAGLALDALLDTAADAVRAAAAAAGVAVELVAFGIPSLIDRGTGVSVRCVHLPLDGVDFGGLMSDRLGVPVAIDNDGNCAVLAEWRVGVAAGCSHVALLTLGTGIGGGLVLDGAVYRGAVGAAAELGHVPVDLDGPPCFGGCPGRGCLEALCSGSALARDASVLATALPESALGVELAAAGSLTGERVTALAQAGDEDARRLLTKLGSRLGAGLAGIAMALNPQMIVLGGGVMAAGDLVLGPARDELRRRALDPARAVRVEAAALGDEAGMIGAALLARSELSW